MKFLPLFLLLIPTVCLAAISRPPTTTPGTSSLPPTTSNSPPVHIAMCRDGTDLDALIAEFQLQPTFIYRPLVGFAAPMDAATVQRLKAHASVECVEKDGPVGLPGWGTQTNSAGLVRMGVDRFPIARINGVRKAPLDVDVAVIDTGIDPHPDLNVYHSVSLGGASVKDHIGHGTRVAGVIGAMDNGFGISGVAPGVRLWNIKAMNDAGVTSWSHIASAMAYLLEFSNQVEVVNMTVGNSGNVAPVGALRLGLQRLVNAGMVVVAAAGNDANDMAGPDGVYGNGDDEAPASIPLAMSVTAMDPYQDRMAPFSNFSQIARTDSAYTGVTNTVVSPGGAIDVAAPGVNILTTAGVMNGGTNGGYVYASGTSFAAPHVAGLVALYIAANGRATNAAGVYRIRQAIIDAALPQSQWNTTNTLDPDSHPEPLAIASEAWIPKPAITNRHGGPGSFGFGFAAVPGYDYTVQSTDDLTPPVAWTNVTQHSGSNFLRAASFTDSSSTVRRFYRLSRRSSLEQPPVILSQSSQVRVPAGSNAMLNMFTVGLPPLGFQWRKDGLPVSDGGSVSGAVTDTLVLSNAQPGDAGAYIVVMTNAFGSATSVVATVTVLTNWATNIVAGVLAIATSELGPPYYRYTSNLVDGSVGQVWQTVGIAQPEGNDPEPTVTFDLGVTRALDRTQIWNGSEPGPAVRRLVIETSIDGTVFHPLNVFTLTTLSPASESLSLGGVVARYVRFAFQENGRGQPFPAGYAPYDGTGYIQMEEVQFHEYLGD